MTVAPEPAPGAGLGWEQNQILPRLPANTTSVSYCGCLRVSWAGARTCSPDGRGPNTETEPGAAGPAPRGLEQSSQAGEGTPDGQNSGGEATYVAGGGLFSREMRSVLYPGARELLHYHGLSGNAGACPCCLQGSCWSQSSGRGGFFPWACHAWPGQSVAFSVQP